MIHKSRLVYWLLTETVCFALFCAAQQERKISPEVIPDAPSASRPLQFPFTLDSRPFTAPASSAKFARAGHLASGTPGPPLTIETVPPGGEAPSSAHTRDELYTLSKKVNFVVIPVTVKDNTTGRMVNGLLAKNFSVYENGVEQKVTYFTSDPFLLSVAIIYDLGMADLDVRKINQTFPALAGAFSQYDEASIYTFTDTVGRFKDFTGANQLTAALNPLKTVRGRNNGVPVLSGPLAFGPVLNGAPVLTSSGVYLVNTPPRVAHVLNDAILQAALDLAKQDNTRRKVIFIISDGHELESTASYPETLRVLLSQQITVYAVATGSSALPGYKQVSQLHLPLFAYDNLLPSYAAATGGEVFTEYSAQAIQTAYATAMSDARNQYTLGYQARAAQSDKYREIDVRINIANLDVHAKAGYYSLPLTR